MMVEEEALDQINKRLIPSIELGVNYLYEHQFPNGEFCCYYAPDDKMKEWCVPDSTVFPASLISACLLSLRNYQKVEQILSSAANFLRYQMMRGGVWNYFTKWNPLFKYLPASTDDTVFASHILKSLQVDFTENTDSILANRNSKGLFYTWFIIRPFKLAHFDREYLMIMIRELKRPLRSVLFWWKHDAKRNDIDAVVNANILFYLGLNENTRPVIDYLLNVISEEKERNCDKWYKNPITIYYFISRNYKKINELEPAKDLVIKRLHAFYHDRNGSFGSSALETALAISTLINFNYVDHRVQKAVKFLLDSQQQSGYWDRSIFFYAGSSKVVGWGSEEITTGYCIEALEAYRRW